VFKYAPYKSRVLIFFTRDNRKSNKQENILSRTSECTPTQ